MDARKKFLTTAGVLLAGSAMALVTIDVRRENLAKDLAKEEGRAMERSSLELQTEDVIGGITPEEFYVVSGDTVYLKVDGRPLESYFRR